MAGHGKTELVPGMDLIEGAMTTSPNVSRRQNKKEEKKMQKTTAYEPGVSIEKKGSSKLLKWLVVLVVLGAAVAVGSYLYQQSQKPMLVSALESAGFQDITYYPAGSGQNPIPNATTCGSTFVFVEREVEGGQVIQSLAVIEEPQGSFNFQIPPACNQAGIG